MAMIRDLMNAEELEASRVLDLAAVGGDVPDSAVTWALWVPGDLTGMCDA